MRCNTFEEHIQEYLDDAMEERDAREMQSHEAACETCRGLMADMRAMRGALCELGAQEAPDNLHDVLMQAVRAEARKGKPKRRMNPWGVAGLAAAAVIVAIVLPLAGMGLLTGGGSMQEAEYSPYMAAGEKMADGGGGYAAATAAPMPSPAPAAANEGAMMDMAEAPRDGLLMSGSADYAAESYDAQKAIVPDAIRGAAHGVKLIRTGYLSLETRAFDEDLARLTDMVAYYEGYVESSNVSGVPYNADPNSYGRWANLSVRVPAGALDAFQGEAKAVGNLLDSSINAQDITAQYQDTQLKLDTLRTQHKRLLELMAKAEAVEDMIAIETKLADIQYQIDSLSGALKDWDARVEYASISISLSEVKSYSLAEPIDPTLGERISQGFYKGLRDFIEGLQNVLVFVVSSLPAMLVIVAAAVGLFFLVRRIARKRKPKPHRDDDPPAFSE